MVESLSEEEKVDFSERHSFLAFERFKEAEECFEGGKYPACIYDCYYSVFHITKAVLYLLGVEAQTHNEVYRMISLHLFSKKEEGKVLSRIFLQLRNLRNSIDYDVLFYFNVGGRKGLIHEAKKALEDANCYITVMEKIRKRLIEEMKRDRKEIICTKAETESEDD